MGLEDYQAAMDRGDGLEFDEREQMMMGPAGVPGMHDMPGELMGAPRAMDPRALVVRSPASGGIRPEVAERLEMVGAMAEQGMLEQAADFIPHPGSVQLTGAERSRFDRLANDIAKAAAKAAKKQSKMGNIGNGRPLGWQQQTAGLPNYDHGTALDGIRAIENLRDKGMRGGALTSWWTNRSLKKADSSIASWGKQRHFWNRRNGMATASAVGAMIERGAAPGKIAKAIKNTYGELLSVAWRDARTGDIETSLQALSNLEMLAQAPDVPEAVRGELQRKLTEDEGKIRKTRLRAFEVGIPYLVNMVARQKNMNQHASAEQLLGRVMYLAKKFDAVKAAGGADAPVVDDGRPVSGDDIRRHIHRRDLYTRRLLTKMMKRYGEGGIVAGTLAVRREALTPQITAELQEIEAQMGGLEQEADQMHAQLMQSGKTPQEADELLEQQFLPVFQQLGARHEQLSTQLAQLHEAPEMQGESGPHLHSRVHAGNVSPALSIMPGSF